VRLTNRVRKLEAAVPKCDGRVRYLAGPDHVPSEADRCRICGGCHVLVIEEEIVEAGPDGHPVPVAAREDQA
jgi:hypothetical protein